MQRYVPYAKRLMWGWYLPVLSGTGGRRYMKKDGTTFLMPTLGSSIGHRSFCRGRDTLLVNPCPYQLQIIFSKSSRIAIADLYLILRLLPRINFHVQYRAIYCFTNIWSIRCCAIHAIKVKIGILSNWLEVGILDLATCNYVAQKSLKSSKQRLPKQGIFACLGERVKTWEKAWIILTGNGS